MVFISRDILKQSYGQWEIEVKGFSFESAFELEVKTFVQEIQLHLQDQEVLQQLYVECCQGNLCRQLYDALNTEKDLCHTIPTICDQDGHLISLDLTAEGLRCQFPDYLSNLTEIEDLYLSHNEVRGNFQAISSFIANTPSLKHFKMQSNQIHGHLDCSWLATNITSLQITYNEIQGTIPPCFFTSHSLLNLQLDGNRLTGAVPSIPVNSPIYLLSLRWQIGEYRLNGTISDNNFQKLAQLQFLELSGNQFSGSLPQLPTNIVYFRVQSNYLNGTIPESYSQLQLLKILHLDNNFLSGTIPSYFGSETNQLEQLILDQNQLTGTIFKNWSDHMQYKHISLFSNQITGQLPGSMGQLPKLTHLYLHNNQINGTLLEFSQNLLTNNVLIVLDLYNNKLTGTVPQELSKLGAIRGVSIYRKSYIHQIEHDKPENSMVDLQYNDIYGQYPYFFALALLNTPHLRIYTRNTQITCPTSDDFRKIDAKKHGKQLQGQVCYYGNKLVFLNSYLEQRFNNNAGESSSISFKKIMLSVAVVIVLIVVVIGGYLLFRRIGCKCGYTWQKFRKFDSSVDEVQMRELDTRSNIL